MNASVTFRADASVTMGTGHIMRCLTLADALSARGADIQFVCTPQTADIVPRLRQQGYKLATEVSPGSLLVIDHYGLDLEYERQISREFQHVMVIDDLPQRPRPCHILLDQTYGRRAQHWEKWVPVGTQILAGTDYLLLRPEFRSPAPPRQNLKSILITMGGTDPQNVTSLVLEGLHQTGLDLDIHVIMGQQAPYLDAIATQISQFKHGTLHINTPHMDQLMRQTDLAIGAGGTTAWERCALSLPTLLLTIADNQKDVVAALVQAQAAVTCALSPAEIAAQVLNLYHSPDQLNHLSRQAGQICPGNGTDKVADILFTLLKESK